MGIKIQCPDDYEYIYGKCYLIVKEPKNAKIISCSNHTPGNLTGNILFKDCFGTDEGQELSKENF